MPVRPLRRSHVSLIGIPMDLGSSLRGVDMGPSAIRIAGVSEKLRGLGYHVHDLGNVSVPHAKVAQGADQRMKFAKPIREACRQLGLTVEGVLNAGRIPLVLGGDHSIAMGTLSGLARWGKRRKRPLGLLWVDAHGDCNNAQTSPSGNVHGMPLAVALGLGDPLLTELAGKQIKPMIDPSRTVLFGVRDLDSGEKDNLRKLGVRVFTMREIDEHGVYNLMRQALELVTRDNAGFHLSFDMDSIDPTIAPGVGTPVAGGLTVREAHLIMELSADTGRMASMEVVEVNPVLDQANKTARLATDLIETAFGDAIL